MKRTPFRRVVVTGGAGFLGSHMCDRLLAEGSKVTCIDNMLTGSLDNISHLLENDNFTLVEHDISDKLLSIDKGRMLDVDAVLHFASPASPIDYLKYPIETLKVGSMGTLNALNLAKQHDAVFLLASTSEVYGDPQVNPQPESYNGNVNPIGQRSVYDEAKRFAESLTMAYRREFMLETRIVRIFNTYGPRMRINDGRIVSNFIVQALLNKDVTIYGTGEQTRSLNYVDDTVNGILKLLYLNSWNAAFPVNIGNPKELTVNAIAELIKDLTGSTSKIRTFPLPQDDPTQRRPDLRRAEALLQYEPRIGLEYGLDYTIEYFRFKLQQESQHNTTTPISAL